VGETANVQLQCGIKMQCFRDAASQKRAQRIVHITCLARSRRPLHQRETAQPPNDLLYLRNARERTLHCSRKGLADKPQTCSCNAESKCNASGEQRRRSARSSSCALLVSRVHVGPCTHEKPRNLCTAMHSATMQGRPPFPENTWATRSDRQTCSCNAASKCNASGAQRRRSARSSSCALLVSRVHIRPCTHEKPRNLHMTLSTCRMQGREPFTAVERG
jgi:hypothetical protein